MPEFLTFGGSSRKTVTTPGTAVQLSTTSTACRRIDVCAETNNTGMICAGNASVVASIATRCGIPLSAGDFYSFEVQNLNEVYIDSTVATDGITFSWWKG